MKSKVNKIDINTIQDNQNNNVNLQYDDMKYSE